jgi:hypothetical protein
VLSIIVEIRRSTSMSKKQQKDMEQRAQHMDEPLKKHGDKIDLRRLSSGDQDKPARATGRAGEPQTTPLEPEKQGGTGGP